MSATKAYLERVSVVMGKDGEITDEVLKIAHVIDVLTKPQWVTWKSNKTGAHLMWSQADMIPEALCGVEIPRVRDKVGGFGGRCGACRKARDHWIGRLTRDYPKIGWPDGIRRP